MALDTGQNQNQTEFMCEEQFNETIRMFLDGRHDKEKSLWTRERIKGAVTSIEQFKLAPVLNLQWTNKQYYYGKKYDLMEVGTKKSLILKRKSDFDPTVKIVPTEEFYHILRESHQSTGHGGRDKMVCNLKSRYLIPTSVVLEFFKLCTICQSKKKFPRKAIVVCPIVSSYFNHRGQVNIVDLQSTQTQIINDYYIMRIT
ncbi:hypothetical protein ILUMI_14043 [Ignelater luminosus]|uniref:Integrase zinc-binding domain-containing protein n=1 Tax=Ignelater luminosus TaxID=2038154 RepID=A0A8K0CV02_IGNLU|nr:hypothetical protein ILUMI_14043 [Ignelater luminosus]